jgi:preprotein translocase subunit YajC
MNAVARALSLGYSANQVIQYLSSTNPDMKEKIKKAKRTGYSEKSILDFLSSEPTNIEGPIQTPTEAYQEKLGSDTRNVATALGGGAALVGTLGSYALGRVLPTAVKGILSNSNQNPSQQISPQFKNSPVPTINHGSVSERLPINNETVQNQEQQFPEEHPVQEEILETLKENPIDQKKENAREVLDAMNLTSFVEKLSTTAPPEDIAQVLEQYMLTPGQKKWLKMSVKTPLSVLVDDFVKSQADQNPVANSQQQSAQEIEPGRLGKKQSSLPPEDTFGRDSLDAFETPTSPEMDIAKPQNDNQQKKKSTEKGMESAPTPIKKGDTVITKTGRLGKILDVRDGIASYREGSETKHRKESEIQAEPEIIKSAKIVFDPKTIPENTKSSALGFVTTNKHRTTVDIMYGPSGEFTRFYKKDGSQISEEDIEKIRNGMTTPVTSGDTYMGLWDTSVSDSRGAHVASEFKAKSQPWEEGVESDPKKDYWAETLESPFIHGYIKSFLDALSDSSKKYAKASNLRKKVNEFKKNRD